jgi:hypothetical protein
MSVAGSGDERFVTQTFHRNIGACVGGDDLLKFGKIGANGQKFLQLRMTGDENHPRAAMFEDVGHAIGRFVEVNRDGDAAGAGDGEIRGMPFGTVGGEKTDAIARLHTKFDERGGKTGDTAKEFLGRDGVPAAVAAGHLRARGWQLVDGVEEARREGAVVHGRKLTLL